MDSVYGLCLELGRLLVQQFLFLGLSIQYGNTFEGVVAGRPAVKLKVAE